MTSNELLWYVSRATGLASIVLLTVVLVLGVLGPIRRASGRKASDALPPAVSVGLHRTLALGMVCFLAVHVVTAVVETYVDIGWLSVIVPFTSGYKPLSVGLGAIALDLLVAVVATALLRKRLPAGLWRVVHRAAYALWPVAALHGLLLGAGEPALLRYVTVACLAAGLFAVLLRWLTSPGSRPVTGARTTAPADPQPQPPARPGRQTGVSRHRAGPPPRVPRPAHPTTGRSGPATRRVW